MAPQLFLINRAIRAEALGYLYRKHHFLVLDYEMEGLRYMLDDYRVPRVAHREPKLFRYYALHLSLRAESRFAGGKLDPIRGCMCGADVMLMQDLPRLVEVLRLSGHKTRARYVYVDTEREKPVEPKFPKALYGVVDKMSLELTKGREECAHLSYPEMDQAMRTLETIIGGNLEMSWTGFQGCTVQMPRAQLVSPKLVWLRALEWDRLQLLLQFKARADNLATSPSRAKQMAAATMYQHLLHDHDSKLSCIPTSSLDAELLRVRSWLANLGIDLMASCTQMWLRFGQPEGYQGYLRQLPVPLEGATETTALIANLHLESAVEEYLGCYSGRSVKEAKRRVRDWVWLVEGMVENWREEEVGRCRGVLEANLGVGREVLFLTGAPFVSQASLFPLPLYCASGNAVPIANHNPLLYRSDRTSSSPASPPALCPSRPQTRWPQTCRSANLQVSLAGRMSSI